MTLALSKEEFLHLLLNFPEDNSSVNKDLIFTTLSLVHSENIYSYTQQEINSIINKKGYLVSDFFEFLKNIPIKKGEENSDHVDISGDTPRPKGRGFFSDKYFCLIRT